MVALDINSYRHTCGICFSGQGEEERIPNARQEGKEGYYKGIWKEMVRWLYKFNTFTTNQDRSLVSPSNICWADMGDCSNNDSRSLLDVLHSSFRITHYFRKLGWNYSKVQSSDKSRESIPGGDR